MTDPAAVAFLRRLREGLDAGLELPEALTRGAAALPREARDTLERVLRRLESGGEEDEWGFDEDFTELVEPFFAFLYDRWWRVKVEGAHRVPAHGRALLASNHAGILPWDATMISVALLREHPLPRHPRFLVLNWAFDLPWVSVFMRKVGGVVASPYNALRLLEQDQLVAVFPEGVKGTGKPFGERYRLQRFGRGGFVEIALRAGAPIVPGRGRRQRGDLPQARRRPRARARDRRAVLPGHADVPLARPARRGPAAVEVADRVLRADRDGALRARRGGRPRPRARADRAGARHDPAGALREPGPPRLRVRLTSTPVESRRPPVDGALAQATLERDQISRAC